MFVGTKVLPLPNDWRSCCEVNLHSSCIYPSVEVLHCDGSRCKDESHFWMLILEQFFFKHRIDILKSLLGFSYANFCTLQILFGDELVFDNLKPCDVDNNLDSTVGIWIKFNDATYLNKAV